MKSYTVVVEGAEDGTWSAYVPDLPGCTAGGATPEEVRSGIETSVRLWLEEMRGEGLEAPPPRAQSFSVAV